MTSATAPVRTMGVEEELLLVDPGSEIVQPVSERALAIHRERSGGPEAGEGAVDEIGQELFLHQLETATTPCETSTELLREIVSARRKAAASAEAAGAALVAVATPVLPYDDTQVTPKPRYEHIVEEFGEIGRQAVVCAAHVHVAISDEFEGVGVIDGMRPWLPVLRALSVNSPYWQGRDTGYASWRSQVWSRFPSAGPSDPFLNPAGYDAATQALIGGGAAVDAGMLYLDARLSRRFPTVEVRVFDVMTEPGDTVLIAMLTRALVTTIAENRPGLPVAPGHWRTDLLRSAHWRASRYGLSSDLLDPVTGRPEPARAVVERLLQYVDPALRTTGEDEPARRQFEEVIARGTGAARQRAAFEATGSLEAVVADLRRRFAATLESTGPEERH